MSRDGAEMTRQLRALSCDAGLRASLVRSGLERIAERHTCAHRAEELLGFWRRLDPPPQGEVAAGRRGFKAATGTDVNPLSPFGTAPPEGEHRRFGETLA